MEPPPLTDQPKLGCGFIGWLFWSRAVAENCCVPPVGTEVLVGATVIEVRVCAAPQPGKRNERSMCSS